MLVVISEKAGREEKNERMNFTGVVEQWRRRTEKEREICLDFVVFFYFRWLHFQWNQSPRAAISALVTLHLRLCVEGSYSRQAARPVNCWAVSALCGRRKKVYKPQTSGLWTVPTLAAVCSLWRRKAYSPQRSRLWSVLTLTAVYREKCNRTLLSYPRIWSCGKIYNNISD